MFNAGTLAQAFKLPYATAERIIHEVQAKHQRRWLPLTVAGMACALAGLFLAWFGAPDQRLPKQLCFTVALVLFMTVKVLTRRAARQPIRNAARQASPRKAGS